MVTHTTLYNSDWRWSGWDRIEEVPFIPREIMMTHTHLQTQGMHMKWLWHLHSHIFPRGNNSHFKAPRDEPEETTVGSSPLSSTVRTLKPRGEWRNLPEGRTGNEHTSLHSDVQKNHYKEIDLVSLIIDFQKTGRSNEGDTENLSLFSVK